MLSACFSIDLSLIFARTSKNLEEQLIQLHRFSWQALENERLAKEEELARQLVEADNARTTKEREDAREESLLHASLGQHDTGILGIKGEMHVPS